jgi:hypothetical protein
MDHNYRSGFMGMRIYFGWTAMGSPAGMADPTAAPERRLLQELFQIAQFTLASHNFGRSVLDGADSGRVVSPVLQLLQAFEDDRSGIFVTDISNNSAHRSGLFLLLEFDFPLQPVLMMNNTQGSRDER